MNSKRIAFGIGMVLAVLAVLTAPVAAENIVYFVPQDSNATTGNTTWVTVYLELEEGETLIGGGLQIKFDPAHADIISCSKGCGAPVEGKHCWGALDKNFEFTDNGYMWGGVSDPQEAVYDSGEGMWIWQSTGDGMFHGPMTVNICKYEVEAVGLPGESPLDFGVDHHPAGCPLCVACEFGNKTGAKLVITWINGTFTHEPVGPTQTFTKSLPEGWNLISLPLEPTITGNSVDKVLSGVTQNAVKRYNATSKQFETATTMDPGIGYFVHVTDPSGSTWSYQGSPVPSTNPGLKSGLNMIGVPNCAIDVGTAMGTTDYRYVARWNTTAQKYEVYNPVAPSVFHGFTEMTAGEGYFVSAKSDCALTISCPP